MLRLYPCPICQRHVSVEELECPFCRAGLEPPAARRQYQLRQAQVMLSLTLASAALACGSATPGASAPAQPDAGRDEAERSSAASSDAGAEAASNANRPAEPQVRDAGPPAQERAVVAVYSATVVVFPGVVGFKLHSTRMRADTREPLRVAAEALNVNPEVKLIELQGHADASEGKAASWLAKQRAQVVYDELVRLGVDPKRLRTAGYGTSRPRGPRETPETNARVELKVLEMEE